MKRYLFFIYFFFLNFFLINNVKSNIENAIVIKINNKILTEYEVKNKILRSLFLAGEEFDQKKIDSIKKQVLENLIDLKLKEIQLEKFNFELNEARINQYIEKISGKNVETLKNDFKNLSLNFELFFEEIETELKWQQFIFKNYANKINIDETEIENKVQQIMSSNITNEEINLSEIMIYNSSKSKNKIIKKIQEEIEINGFENTAVKFSISDSSSLKGKLGWVNKKILSKNISRIIENMEIGQVSEPIVQVENILFLKLNDKRLVEKKDINVNNLKKNLINQHKNEMFNLFSISHLSKLKNNYLIEFQ